MDIFEVMDSFRGLSRKETLEALTQYLQKGDEPSAARLLGRVGMLERPVAGEMLRAALEHCSAALLHRLLDHVPRGEYAGKIRVGGKRWVVQGTLPTLAAALGRAEHLRVLLDCGCDGNSASLDATTALQNMPNTFYGHEASCMRGHRTTVSESAAFLPLRRGSFGVGIYGLTPLAAAIAFGREACVRLLLKREGVWREECPAVSEALAVQDAPWEIRGEHQTCRGLIRTLPSGSERPLLLRAAVRHMNEATLRDELCRCTYDREEIVQTALALLTRGLAVPNMPRRRAMLATLAGRYPDAMRDERVARKLAAEVWEWEEALPEAIQNTLGETVDLDEVSFGAGLRSAAAVKGILRLYGKSKRLVMSCDRIGSKLTTDANCLRALIRSVEFRAPSLPIGVSGLTSAILCSGDSKLLQEALERGLIPAEEPIDRLLELAGKNTAARAMLLTAKRPSFRSAPPGAEQRTLRVLTPEETERILSDPALRAQASDALIEQLAGERFAQRRAVLRHGGFATWDEMAGFALRGETDMVLRLMRRQESTVNCLASLTVQWEGASDTQLILTPLCCAAAAGQIKTVEALLDAGYDPEGQDVGYPSVIAILEQGRQTEQLAASPLLCALLWERWDTAVLLLRRGAACDLTCYTVRRAFEVLRGGDVPYADILRELGGFLTERQLAGPKCR